MLIVIDPAQLRETAIRCGDNPDEVIARWTARSNDPDCDVVLMPEGEGQQAGEEKQC